MKGMFWVMMLEGRGGRGGGGIRRGRGSVVGVHGRSCIRSVLFVRAPPFGLLTHNERKLAGTTTEN